MPTHRERHAKRAAEQLALPRKSARADEAPNGVRLDKWLWAARFFKTRALAQQAIEAGKVKHDGERCKPAHTVRIGDCYAIIRENLIWNIAVVELSGQRAGAVQASRMYAEPAESIEARMEAIAQRKLANGGEALFRGRPTKRQRRKIEDFLAEP
jgi:ribosome-associated heat shock protein Hsp15